MEILAAGCSTDRKEWEKWGERLGGYCNPGRGQQELGLSGEQESGGVSCLISFLQTWLEIRVVGEVVGIIPMDGCVPLTVTSVPTQA